MGAFFRGITLGGWTLSGGILSWIQTYLCWVESMPLAFPIGSTETNRHTAN